MTIEIVSKQSVISRVKRSCEEFFREKSLLYIKRNNVFSFRNNSLILFFSRGLLTIIAEQSDPLLSVIIPFLKDFMGSEVFGVRLSEDAPAFILEGMHSVIL